MDSFHRKIGSALLVMATGTFLSSLLYNGEYSFFHNPVSLLGQLKTLSGFSNLPGHIAFAITCLLSGGIFLSAWRQDHRKSLLLIGIGLLFMPIPCDRYLQAHQLASGFAVGGAYFYCAAYLFFHKTKKLSLILFQAAVLFYAVLHITGSYYKEEFQTFAAAAIFLAMADSIKACRTVRSQTPQKVKARLYHPMRK